MTTSSSPGDPAVHEGFPSATVFVRRSAHPSTVLIFPLPAARDHAPVAAFRAGVVFAQNHGTSESDARAADDWGDAAVSFEAGRRCAMGDPGSRLWYAPSAEHFPVFPLMLEDWHRRHPRTDLVRLRAAVSSNQPVFAQHDGEWVASDWDPVTPQAHRNPVPAAPKRVGRPRPAVAWQQMR